MDLFLHSEADDEEDRKQEVYMLIEINVTIDVVAHFSLTLCFARCFGG